MKKRERINHIITYILLGMWTIIALFPIYWALITSFKRPIDVFNGPKFFPFIDYKPTLEPWIHIFTSPESDSKGPLINSIIISFTSSIIVIIIGSMSAYALTRFKFGSKRFGNKDIAFWMISQRMFPPIAVVLPYFLLFRVFHLLDTRIGMIIVYTMFNLPLAVWLMRDFMAGIPREIEESAWVDGASRIQIFTRIILPLSKPGMVATFLISVVFAWNEFLFALILTFQRAQTLPLMIAAQNTSRGPLWWYISTLAIITILPTAIIALFLEKYMVKGLTFGSIK